MRTSVLTFLASVALSSAAALTSATTEPATIVVEKLVDNFYQNTTIEVQTTYDYTNATVLDQVSSLYQIGPEYTYFCFAIKPDGSFYGDEWFGLDKPLRLSIDNVVVKAITCRVE